MSQFHRAAAGAALLALGLGMSGCGGSANADAGKTASVAPSVAPTSASPSPTKKPKPKPKPLSPYEGNPAVKVARKWAAAYGRDINHGRNDLASAQRYESATGRSSLARDAHDDIGLHYPGPLPFTPTSVNITGAKATVTACMWEQGFATKDGRPARKKKTGPVTFAMTRSRGHWLLDAVEVATADCSGVRVKGVKW